MRRFWAWPLILGFVVLSSLAPEAARAACTVPNTLTNGQTADASQVMANFNSVLGCVNTAPSGSTNALQYNAGTGAFGGIGPLTNGQIAIGSTGNAPQAGTLTAGPGIAITNGPGSITISNGTAVYTPPKLANFTWGNQPTGTTGTDTSTGLAMYQPNQGGENLGVLWDTTPIPSTTPFTTTIGVDISANGSAAAGLAIGDGSGKFISFEFIATGGGAEIQADCTWSNYTTYSGGCAVVSMYPTTVLIQVNYDGTNFNFSAGTDINSLVPVGSYTASSFIGTPTQIGLYLRGYSSNVGTTFFHYHRSDGAP